MKIERPRFELTRVYSDGTKETPEIVPVTEMPWDTKMNRRGALGFGLTATAVLLMLKGCSDEYNIFSTQTVKEVEIQDSPDIQRKSPDAVLQAHKQGVFKLSFSSDSATIVSASSDSTVKQWSVPDGKLLATVSIKSSTQFWSDVTPDGKTLIVESPGGEIGFWSLPQGTLLKKIPGGASTVIAKFALASDGKVFASAQGNTIKLYSVPEGELLNTLTDDSQKNIMFLSFAPNGKILVSAAADEEIKLRSVPDGNMLGKLAGGVISGFSNPPSLLINSANDRLAMLINGQIHLWSLPDGNRIKTVFKDSLIQNLMITPDGKTLITTGRYFPTPATLDSPPDYSAPVSTTPTVSNAIKLWSFPEIELLSVGKIKVPASTDAGLAKMAVTLDGKTLAVVFYNGYDVWLVSLPELKLETVLKGTNKANPVFAISPDGKLLAIGDYGGVIMLWDLEKKEFLSYLFDKTATKSSVKGVAYNVTDKVTGRTITYTLPCGSPIPPGAVCSCNCVPGTYAPYTPPAPKRRAPRRRSSGGWGTYCSCNKICTCIPVPSDRNVKEAFESTDLSAILQRLSELPIKTWSYKWDDASIRHIGPMAQDFAAAFNVGDDDKHIYPVDAQGVAFAAIQALYRVLKDKEAQTENLQAQLQEQQLEKKRLETRIEALEELIKSQM